MNNPPLYNKMNKILLAEPNINPLKIDSDKDEDRKTPSLRILNLGEYKWLINEYTKQLLPLEGRLYARPRIRRIYEITIKIFQSQLENCHCLLMGNGWWTSREKITSKSLELLVDHKDFLESQGYQRKRENPTPRNINTRYNYGKSKTM
jgi:hypothetical protein